MRFKFCVEPGPSPASHANAEARRLQLLSSASGVHVHVGGQSRNRCKQQLNEVGTNSIDLSPDHAINSSQFVVVHHHCGCVRLVRLCNSLTAGLAFVCLSLSPQSHFHRRKDGYRAKSHCWKALCSMMVGAGSHQPAYQ